MQKRWQRPLTATDTSLLCLSPLFLAHAWQVVSILRRRISRLSSCSDRAQSTDILTRHHLILLITGLQAIQSMTWL